MTDWDKSVDLLIAGSGGGGMVAALAALDSGLEPLVVEKQALIGGATGMSGGMVWLPNNPLMRAEGVPDSHEDGLAYFDDVVGDIGEASSPARREVFLTAGNEMINFLVGKGVRLARCPGYSDYYPNHKGGNAAGRSVEGIPYDAAALGDWSDKLQRMDKNWNRGFVVKTSELRHRAVLQPLTTSVRSSHAGVPAYQGGPTPGPRHPHQRCVTHRSDAEEPDRSARRATHLDEHGNGRPDRRGRPRRRRPSYSRRHLTQRRGA